MNFSRGGRKNKSVFDTKISLTPFKSMKPSTALVESPETPSRRSRRTPKKLENSDFVTPTKSREKRNETPRKRKAESSIEHQVTPVKTPAKKTPKKALSSRQATPAKKIQACVVKLQHCDDQSVEQILDIANLNYVSKRRKASSKPNLEDVTEVSTEDDDDDDTRETMKVGLLILSYSYIFALKFENWSHF